MHEGKTTGIFFVVAVVALGLAWWSKPAAITNEDEIAKSRQGQDVFPDFGDPESASSLQIAQYDEELAQLNRFEVARDPQSNLWTLPSHDDYPADAAEQVKDATTPLIGLKVLSVESDLRSDHEMYGVVNPDDEALAAGTSGVGMLITLKNDKDAVLASLIVGKEVTGVEGQRYVRIPTEDAVYKVELEIGAFSTNFRDWIEGELLDVRSFDITRIGVRDYELQQQSLTSMALKRNFDAEVEYDSSASEWNLVRYETFEGGAAKPAELAENESLNKEFLNAMRTAAQDLEIVDVKRKPSGLAADLKADESLLQNEQSVASLQTQGFYPAGGPDGTEIYAASGETIIGTEAGVRYVLRFGEVTANLASIVDTANGEGGLSRYLMVTARLDESQFPFPDIEVAPNTVEEMLAREKGEGESEGSGQSEVDEVGEKNTAKAGETLDEAGQEGGEKPEPSEESKENDSGSDSVVDSTTSSEVNPKEGETTDEQAANKPEDSGDSLKPDDDGQPQADVAVAASEAEIADTDTTGTADTGTADTETTDTEQQPASEPQPAAEGAAQESATETSATTEDKPAETEEELIERLEAMREDIAKENQRKIDDRNEKLEEARQKVQELNTRFSEWFYVISDSEYNELKLTRDNLIKTNEPASESTTPSFGQGLSLPGLEPSFPPQP